jgi:hypothetical protein
VQRIDPVLSAMGILPLESPEDRQDIEFEDTCHTRALPHLLIDTHVLEAGLTLLRANIGKISLGPGINMKNRLRHRHSGAIHEIHCVLFCIES